MKRRGAALKPFVPAERAARAIIRLRGRNVILDADLARLYGTTAKRLNEQLRRNTARFPADFAFQLTEDEYRDLRSQIATSSQSAHGGRRYLPHAFTEHGAIMAAHIVKSPRAVQMSVIVVREFVRYRQTLDAHVDLARKITLLEAKYDSQFATVFEAIRELIRPPLVPRKRIGFLGSPTRGHETSPRRARL